MADFITSDRTFKVGDLVFSTYKKGELLFRITEITRRFLDKRDLYGVYKDGNVGDEINPYVTIEAIANLSITTDPTKKLRKTVKGYDAAWLVRADPARIQAHIKKLNDLLAAEWP